MKNLILGFFSILCSCSFAWANSNAKNDFFKKFPVKEGLYNTVLDVKKTVDFCQNEDLEIELRQDDDNLVLTIGPNLVFAELQKNETISPTEKNCKVKTENSFSSKQLKQVVTETCGTKINYSKTHVLKLNGDFVEYAYLFKGKTQNCKYKFLKEVAK